MRILSIILLLALSIQGAFAATLEAEISHDGQCEGSGICQPVTEFRVYETNGDLVGTASTQGLSTFDLPYEVVNGQEYCYDFTAFNGEESAPVRACDTAEFAQPTSPAVIRLEFK